MDMEISEEDIAFCWQVPSFRPADGNSYFVNMQTHALSPCLPDDSVLSPILLPENYFWHAFMP
jgi:hypothetical protein